MKFGKGWRTLGINLLIAAANVLVTFKWPTVVNGETLMLVNGIGIPAINMWLRYITDTPVGKSA